MSMGLQGEKLMRFLSRRIRYPLCRPRAIPSRRRQIQSGACRNRKAALEVFEPRWVLAAPVGEPDVYSFLADDPANPSDPPVVLTVDPPGVLENDTDEDGDTLQAILLTLPENGVLQDLGGGTRLSADGGFTYTPTLGFIGRDTFTYAVSDGTVQSEPVTVSICVIGPLNDFYSAVEDGPGVTVEMPGVLENDADDVCEAPTAVLLDPPTGGALQDLGDGVMLSPEGAFIYVPNADFAGDDTFTYTVMLGMDQSLLVGTVTIRVIEIPDAPMEDPAAPDVYATAKNTPLEVAAPGVLGNDLDGDGDELTAILDSGIPMGTGTLEFFEDGSFNFTPETDFIGTVTFTYIASDGNLTSSPITVTIDVFEPFMAFDDNYVINEDTVLQVDAATGVLANDEGLDGTEIAGLVQGTVVGDVFLDPDGGFRYEPAPHFFGIETFDYVAIIADGTLFSTVVTVTIEVLPVNDVPEAVDDVYELAFGESLTQGELIGFPKLWFGNGHYYEFVERSATWEEARDFAAELSFRGANGHLATITSSQELDFIMREFGPLDAWLGGFQDPEIEVDPEDPEFDPAAEGWQWVTGEEWDFTAWGNGLPDDVLNGRQNFLEFAPTSANPWGWNDELNNRINTHFLVEYPTRPRPVGVMANDMEFDGEPLAAELISGPSNGFLDFNGNGHFQYIPIEGFFGIDEFTYQVTDGTLTSAPATVTFMVFFAGDADLSGTVDLADFNALKENFGAGTEWTEGDFNGDGTVNLIDFNLLKENFGAASPSQASASAVLAALAIDEALGDDRLI